MTEPKVGEKWTFAPDTDKDDPWARTNTHTVKILDVRAGWVRYDMCDSRRPIAEFMRLYKKA